MPSLYASAARMLPGDRILPKIYTYETPEGGSMPLPQIVQRWRYSPYMGRASLMLFLGLKHSTNPADKQFAVARNEFNLWQHDTHGEPRMLLCEGRVRPSADSEEASIRSDGAESALLAFWSKQRNIPLISWERPIDKQLEALPAASRRDPALLFYYLIGRHQTQGMRSIYTRQRMHAYLEDVIAMYGSILPWNDFDFSYKTFADTHDRLYPGRPLDILDRDFFWQETVGGMFEPKTAIQGVAYDFNVIRGRDLCSTVLRCGNEGIHTFGFSGVMHLGRLITIV